MRLDRTAYRSSTVRSPIDRLPADRATVPVVSVALLLAVTVTLAGVVGFVVVDAAQAGTAGSVGAARTPTVLSASVTGERVVLVHEGGAALDVRDLSLCVTVAGDSLTHQPPVPFFAARGFRPGPTGPFNVASDPSWSAGETASFELAGTNAPSITPGDEVVVVVYADGTRAATARVRAGAAG